MSEHQDCKRYENYAYYRLNNGSFLVNLPVKRKGRDGDQIFDTEDEVKQAIDRVLGKPCQYCRFGGRGKFKDRTPDFILLQDRFAVQIEKDEPYVGDYGLTVSDNEDKCEFTVAINFCPMCGRPLNNDKPLSEPGQV